MKRIALCLAAAAVLGAGSAAGAVGDVIYRGTGFKVSGTREGGPRFKLDKKSGESGFYLLTFKAKLTKGPRRIKSNGWWVDAWDKDERLLADVNSSIDESDEFRDYSELFQFVAEAEYGQVTFHAGKGNTVEATDVELRHVSDAEAADWCDRLYRTLPQVAGPAPESAMWRLPKTRAKLDSGAPLRVVLLGGSLCNDTYNGNLAALLKRDFPLSNPEVVASVRGGTGVWYYQEPEHFKEYVLDRKPDLLLIAGICHRAHVGVYGPKEATMTRFVELCRRHGIETAVCTLPYSKDFRTELKPHELDWRKFDATRCDASLYDNAYLACAAEVTGAPLWNVTDDPCRTVAASGLPFCAFMRDAIHNNDLGKQINARAVAAHFRPAMTKETECGGSLGGFATGAWAADVTDGGVTRRVPFTGEIRVPNARILSKSWRLITNEGRPESERLLELRYRAAGTGRWRVTFFDVRGCRQTTAEGELPPSPAARTATLRRDVKVPAGADYMQFGLTTGEWLKLDFVACALKKVGDNWD